MAAEYSRQLSARTRVAIRRVHCAGGCCGGVSPYGFAKELYDPATGKTRVLRPGERKTRGGQILKYVWGAPEELAILRHIFRQFAAHGKTPAEIAKALNAQGSLFRDGSQWTSQRINSVLDNELAIGILTFGKSYYRFGFRQKSDSKSWSRLKVFEPVVPKLLFAKAHARRALSVKQSISDQALIADLQRLFDRYGAVTHRVVATRGIASPSVYARRFGSLGAALRLAGHPYRVRTRRAWTAETLVWARVKPVLEQLLREEGFLSAAVVDACPYVPRSATLRKYFGHLPDVFSRAGDTSSKAEKMSKAWVTRARRFAQGDERVDMQPHLARPTIQSAVDEEPELRLRREPAFQLGPAFGANAR